MKAILALDQGTTSSRALLFDHSGAVLAVAQREFRQSFPKPGWVEHDAREIWSAQIAVAAEALAKVPDVEILAIGITNQRETTLLWDRKSGEPVANAIVWQDRRTAPMCDALREHEPLFRERTGLLLDPYFSGTKIRWLLDDVKPSGDLAFGTMDTWLIWNLTGGRVHVTDETNASRTLLFDIHRKIWDDELLGLLGVPRAILPTVVGSSAVVGETSAGLPIPAGIPIAGIAGDQQAALFGQRCVKPGMAKNTYGTGSFVVLNTGSEPASSDHGLLTTVACGDQYAMEGAIFVSGAAVQWLRDSLGIIQTAPEIEALAASVDDSGGVIFVPAFTGLGAPQWDPHARASITGLTRGSSAAHIARAALDGIALQVADVLDAMHADSGLELRELRVDGGASANDLLMQIQADLAGIRVVRSRLAETTALGAAYLAGLAVRFWSEEEIETQWTVDRIFEPRIDDEARARIKAQWQDAVAGVVRVAKSQSREGR
jgi:glycerol kinase